MHDILPCFLAGISGVSVLTMDADAQANTAKARAEARRQKILARQKDRLTSITGTYSKQEGEQAHAGAVHNAVGLLLCI
jgi:CO/xanthine dehydrogenase Mo-binding subunit